MMEEWIANGQVSVNGETATLGMRVFEGDLVKAERRTIRVGEREHAYACCFTTNRKGKSSAATIPGNAPACSTSYPNCAGRNGSRLAAWILIPVAC